MHPHISPLKHRCEVARNATPTGASRRQIAAALDRAPSTIARELKRNASHPGLAALCRPAGARPPLARPPPATATPPCAPSSRPPPPAGPRNRSLGQSGPPSGTPSSPMSRSTVIDPRSAAPRTMPGATFSPAPRPSAAAAGASGPAAPSSFIQHRRPLTDRPASAADRQSPGHWEADLMHLRQVRPSRPHPPRQLLPHCSSPSAAGGNSKAAAPIAGRPRAPGRPCRPPGPDRHLRQRHRVAIRSTPTTSRPSSASPSAPWQKGGIRERHRALAPHPAPQNRPRHPHARPLYPARPGLATRRANASAPNPSRGLLDLHLKCESTFPPSRE